MMPPAASFRPSPGPLPSTATRNPQPPNERHTFAGTQGKDAFRTVFSDVNDDVFEFVYALFDWDGDERVSPREFMLTMVSLSRTQSLDEHISMAFDMFDTVSSRMKGPTLKARE